MAKFINTYNFVPFGYVTEEQRTSREQVYRRESSLVSGWLTVRLDTKTPLIIPDGAHPKYYNCETKDYVNDPDETEKSRLHKEYTFFRVPSLEDASVREPVIPGSELRGMIRSIYETVTDSCVPFLLDDKPISQRVPTFGSLRKRGLLAYEPISEGSEERHWVLYSAYADREEVVYDKRDKNNPFRDSNGNLLPENGTYVKNKGWLQYNIPVTKDGYHIAYLNKNSVVFSWDYCDEEGKRDKKRNEEPYDALKTALFKEKKEDEKQDKNEAKNANRIPRNNLAKALEKAKKGGNNLVPVYYFTVKRGEETLVYLSNSSIGRIAQRRKWREIMGDHAPCSSTDKLCPACLLFGTVEDKGLKGHVRFSDAVMTSKPEFETHTLQILGQPRTSAFEFYLRRPENATYWNFDFYGIKVQDKNGNGKKNPNNRNNTHTEYYDLEKSTPRGRKMYWHHPLASDAEKGRMNSTMEAVNGSFEFKVYFDEVTKEQLKNLIWVITLGENTEDSTRQHKLGHARPLGYGSVKMVVTEKVIRHLEVSDNGLNVRLEKTHIAEKANHCLKGMEDIINNLLKMCDTKTIPSDSDIPVMYPIAENRNGKSAIFEWFSQNRKNADYLRTLPEPGDEDLMLSDEWNVRRNSGNQLRGNRANQTRGNNGNQAGASQGKDKTKITAAKPEKKAIVIKPGAVINGKVKQIARKKDGSQYGVFVTLNEKYKGLLHHSKMEHPMEYYTPGKDITVKIISHDDKGTGLTDKEV
ncbi:MAG: TIGR03986 family CRISPR-associated RAMP protein [Lachnospiraceae bacterium]|nr:TIGR03986 family CRISPR-associated RAMP protein [Lachnospiraceae bacterium]